MAAPPVVQIEGARQLRATLKRAGVDVKQLRDAHASAARIAAGYVNAPSVTGALAGTVRAAGTQTAGLLRAGYASVPYAAPIHWGWPSRGVAAQPFLTEAAQRSEPQWVDVFWQDLLDVIGSVEGAKSG